MADNPKLASTLREAHKKPVFFAFVAKGSEGALLAEKKKISPKESAEAKKQLGGGTIFQGRCKGEDGTLVFEIPKPPPATLAALIKKIIKQDAGLTYPVEVRVVADLAEEDEQTEGQASEQTAPPAPPPAPAAAPAAGMAGVIKRLNAMTPQIKAALAGPNKARVQPLFVAVNGHIKNNDHVQADKVLDELAPLIVAAPVAPPSPPPDAARFAARLKALTPMMQKADATRTEAAKAAKLQIGEGNKYSLAKKYEQANAALDKAEALIKQAFAVQPPKQTPKDAGGDATKLQAQWEQRVIAMEPRVLEAKKTRPNDAKWMTLFMSCQDLGEAGDYAKALKILDQLDALLAAPPKASGPNLGPWQTVRQNTVAKLRALASQLAAAQHERAKEAEIEVQSVIKQLTAKPASAQQVAELERYLKQDRVVSDVCTMAFDFRTSLLGALNALKTQMAV